jgi:DNA-damage-inducible protein J
MDEDLKTIDAFCSDIGMSMTTAFVFLQKHSKRTKNSVRNFGRSDPFYNKANIASLEKALQCTGRKSHIERT